MDLTVRARSWRIQSRHRLNLGRVPGARWLRIVIHWTGFPSPLRAGSVWDLLRVFPPRNQEGRMRVSPFMVHDGRGIQRR